MVDRIRCLLLTLLCWLAWPAIVAGAVPPFGISVGTAQVEYGKAVYVRLHTRYTQPSLDTLDLSALDRDFVIHARGDVDHGADSGEQSWRIQLYPRRPGELTIPPLAFHGASTKAVTIRVTPAFDRKDNTPIVVSNDVSGTDVWINQAVRVTMQVESSSRYAWLDAETARQSGVEIEALPHERHASELDVARTLHRIGWVLYPQTTGTITIQLPAVRYHRDGVITHRFYPPGIELHVRALPAFVPPTMPVGRIELQASMPDRLFMVKRELNFLTLRITSEGTPALYLPGLLTQLNSSRSVTFYPPRSIADEKSNRAGSGRDTVYRVPFAPKTIGLVSLPSMRLQYFDPATGKIRTHTQSLGSFIAVSQWIVYAVAAALSVVAIVLLRFAWRWFKRKLQIYRCYRTALRRLRHADTPQAIKTALMEIAGAEFWPTNLTLAAWLHHWATRYPRLSPASVSDSVLRLQGQLYGQTDAALEEIRPCLVDMCYRRVPLLRIMG